MKFQYMDVSSVSFPPCIFVLFRAFLPFGRVKRKHGRIKFISLFAAGSVWGLMVCTLPSPTWFSYLQLNAL